MVGPRCVASTWSWSLNIRAPSLPTLGAASVLPWKVGRSRHTLALSSVLHDPSGMRSWMIIGPCVSTDTATSEMAALAVGAAVLRASPVLGCQFTPRFLKNHALAPLVWSFQPLSPCHEHELTPLQPQATAARHASPPKSNFGSSDAVLPSFHDPRPGQHVVLLLPPSSIVRRHSLRLDIAVSSLLVASGARNFGIVVSGIWIFMRP